MQIDTETRDGKTILAPKADRLDAANSGEFREKILSLLEKGGQQLVVDLSGVNFIDSSGLGALLSGYKSANLRSGSFILTGLKPRVLSMFELTRLHRVFTIVATVEDAMAKLDANG